MPRPADTAVDPSGLPPTWVTVGFGKRRPGEEFYLIADSCNVYLEGICSGPSAPGLLLREHGKTRRRTEFWAWPPGKVGEWPHQPPLMSFWSWCARAAYWTISVSTPMWT